MLQDLFRFHLPFHLPLIGDQIVIHGFGLMLVIGFLIAMALEKFLARRTGQDPEAFANAALLALFTGVLGARLSHVFENFSDFSDPRLGFFGNLANVFNISSGGLTYYGGFLLALPTLVIYAMVKKIPLRLGMDIIAPCLMVGLAFGRIGCFLNGCCYGAECNLPWAVTFPYQSYAYQDEDHRGEVTPPPVLQTTLSNDMTVLIPRDRLTTPQELSAAASQRSRPLHPAQLYSSITAFMLVGILLAYFTMPHAPGMVFALMMILEGVSRFTLELLRVEPPVIHIAGHGWSLSMVLSVFLVAAGLILALVFRIMHKDASVPSRPLGAVSAA